MLSAEEAQTRIDALMTEAQGLEAALLDLESQKATLDKELDADSVAAERQPSRDNERVAVALSSRVNLVNEQLRRKRVGLESCRADLVEARANLERARLAATVVTMEGYYTELAGITATLDANPLQRDPWRRLAEICDHGNRLYRQVRPSDTYTGRVIFPDHGIVINRVIQRIEATLGNATDLRDMRQRKVEFATVAEAMDLERLHKEIAYLRRLHIDAPAQVAPAAALEAVPA